MCTIFKKTRSTHVLKTAIRATLLLAGALMLCPAARGGQPVPVLSTSQGVFTNAQLDHASATHAFLRHESGMAAVFLSELDSTQQAALGIIPNSVTAVGQGNVTANTEATGALVVANARAASPAATLRDFRVDDKGTLSLLTPNLWTTNVLPRPAHEKSYLNIRFKRGYDDDFLLQVTVIPPGDKLLLLGPGALMTSMGNTALQGSAEKRLELKQLTGPGVSGCYFELTDKKLAERFVPKPGQFKYQTQGFVTIGDVGLIFVFFHNYLGTYDPSAAMEMILTAGFEKASPPTSASIR